MKQDLWCIEEYYSAEPHWRPCLWAGTYLRRYFAVQMARQLRKDKSVARAKALAAIPSALRTFAPKYRCRVAKCAIVVIRKEAS